MPRKKGAAAKRTARTRLKSEDSQSGELSAEKLRYYLEDFDIQGMLCMFV